MVLQAALAWKERVGTDHWCIDLRRGHRRKSRGIKDVPLNRLVRSTVNDNDHSVNRASKQLREKDGSSSHVASETSTRDHSPGEANGRPSTASGRPSTLSRSVSYGSSQSLGDSWSEERPATSGSPANGHTPRSGSQRLLEAPEVIRPISINQAQQADTFQSLPRSRGASISRHLTGLSQRLKPTETRDTSTSNGNTDDTEENKRKSRLLLGGQKLFRTLRDQ